VRSGEKKQLPALKALKEFQEERSIQNQKMNELKFNSNIREKKNLINEFLDSK